MSAINIVLGYPDGHWNTWTGYSQAFLSEILTNGALPVRDIDGTYYDMEMVNGVLMLDGVPVAQAFDDGQTPAQTATQEPVDTGEAPVLPPMVQPASIPYGYILAGLAALWALTR